VYQYSDPKHSHRSEIVLIQGSDGQNYDSKEAMSPRRLMKCLVVALGEQVGSSEEEQWHWQHWPIMQQT